MKSKENVPVIATVSHGDHYVDKRPNRKACFPYSRRNAEKRCLKIGPSGWQELVLRREWLPQTAGVFGMREMLYN